MSSPHDLFRSALPELRSSRSETICSPPNSDSVREVLDPLIEATINRLHRKRFDPDPIAGAHYSRVVSIISSAYKRHGHILERGILERLKKAPHLKVWNDPIFHVPTNADLLAQGCIKNPASI